MSLKAYNGMMTRKGFHHLQEKIKEHLPELREASVNQILKTYANYVYDHADGYLDIEHKARLDCQGIDDKKKLEEIEIKEKTTILSYLYQVAKVLSKAFFVNDFCVHLHLTLESKHPKKILVYPNLLVNEHEDILLKFLEDWHAQNQCDPPENVPKKQWKQRCDDWWNFNETRGLSSRITLFDPNSFSDNLVESLRGDELIEGILKFIPTDEKRIQRIQKRKFLSLLYDKYRVEDDSEEKDNGFRYVWKADSYLRTEEGINEFEEFKKTFPVTLVKIDKEYLNSKMDGSFTVR